MGPNTCLSRDPLSRRRLPFLSVSLSFRRSGLRESLRLSGLRESLRLSLLEDRRLSLLADLRLCLSRSRSLLTLRDLDADLDLLRSRRPSLARSRLRLGDLLQAAHGSQKPLACEASEAARS